MSQYFGQDSVQASGDGSVAAGHDVTITEIDTDIEVGDVWTDNTWTTDSFNDDFSDTWSVNDSFQDNSTDDSIDVDVDLDVENSNVGSPFGDANEFDF